MAGVPEIGWRRSLDRCSVQPSLVPIPMSMDLHYRELYGLAKPAGRDLTNATSPVPKPIRLAFDFSK